MLEKAKDCIIIVLGLTWEIETYDFKIASAP